MTRPITLLLALVLLVFNAAGLEAASAAEFHSAASSTTLTGSQVGTISFTAGSGSGSVSCTVASFSGSTTAKTVSAWTLTPKYEGCKDGFGRTAHLTILGDYHLTPARPTEEAVGHITGTIVIHETPGGGLGECTIETHSQTVNGFSYHNGSDALGFYVDITLNSTNVVSTTSGGLFNCGLSNGTHTGGSLTGVSRVRGSNGGVATSVWVE